jgi:hypothetical protein
VERRIPRTQYVPHQPEDASVWPSIGTVKKQAMEMTEYGKHGNSNKRAAQSKVLKMMVSSEGTKAAIVGTTDSRKQAQDAG